MWKLGKTANLRLQIQGATFRLIVLIEEIIVFLRHVFLISDVTQIQDLLCFLEPNKNKNVVTKEATTISKEFQI